MVKNSLFVIRSLVLRSAPVFLTDQSVDFTPKPFAPNLKYQLMESQIHYILHLSDLFKHYSL